MIEKTCAACDCTDFFAGRRMRPFTRSPRRTHDLERFVGAERSTEFNQELGAHWVAAAENAA